MLVLFTSFFFLLACDKTDDSPSLVLPDQILLNDPGLYPEGLAYDPDEAVFYVSSVAKGRITKVHLDGTFEHFADDPDLISTLGLELDQERGWLWACNTDPGLSERSTEQTMGQLAEIVAYDLQTGQRVRTIKLASQGPHLANDLVLDDHGNVYVSDSFSPVIYRVSPEGTVSKLIEDDRFLPQPMNFGLNGLAYHPAGFLIAAKYDEGRLFKIPIDQPDNFTEIEIASGLIPAIDGVLLENADEMVLASNNLGAAAHDNAVFRLRSEDNWSSASITHETKTGAGSFPTTFTRAEGKLYIQYARLQALFAGENPPSPSFPIVEVAFE